MHQRLDTGSVDQIRAVINSSGPKLRLVDELKKPRKDVTQLSRMLADVERKYIIGVLEELHWKVSGQNSTPQTLSLDRSTLRARTRKLNILRVRAKITLRLKM